MRQLKSVLTLSVLVLLFLSSCKKEIRDESGMQPSLQNELPTARAAGMTAAQRARAKQIRASLPSGVKERIKTKTLKFLRLHPQYRNMVSQAVKATAPPCDPNTPVFSWLDDQLAEWNDDIFFLAVATGMLEMPLYDALFFQNTSANQYFGINGAFTHRVTKTFKDLQRFWNIRSSDIALVGLHGTMLQDRARVVRIGRILFPEDTEEVNEFFADVIVELMDVIPQYREGNHPIFSFNSFAQSRFAFPPFGIVPNKIVMGDGILEGFAALGYGDVAPQAILAHEFGHHIQFQLNLFGEEATPEATRRTELMADAYSSYYLSHARGASMQWKRVKLFLSVFFNIGDCSTGNPGHHGTPRQRMSAAEWGYSVANDAQKQGHILTAQQFTAKFEAALPGILRR
jgi:hypothetical protein